MLPDYRTEPAMTLKSFSSLREEKESGIEQCLPIGHCGQNAGKNPAPGLPNGHEARGGDLDAETKKPDQTTRLRSV